MDLYIKPPSPPCRAILLAAKALNLKLNVKIVAEGDNKTPEFLKMNPQQTVPTLDDSGFYLWESRAILTYLVNKYGTRDDPLYPKDPKQRALVEQRLYFDAITLYPAVGDCYYPVMFGGQSEPDPQAIEKIKQALELFDTFLDSSEFAAIDTFSVADIALLVTVSTLDACEFDFSAYKKVVSWYNKAKEACAGYNEVNEGTLQLLKDLYNKSVKK